MIIITILNNNNKINKLITNFKRMNNYCFQN